MGKEVQSGSLSTHLSPPFGVASWIIEAARVTLHFPDPFAARIHTWAMIPQAHVKGEGCVKGASACGLQAPCDVMATSGVVQSRWKDLEGRSEQWVVGISVQRENLLASMVMQCLILQELLVNHCPGAVRVRFWLWGPCKDQVFYGLRVVGWVPSKLYNDLYNDLPFPEILLAALHLVITTFLHKPATLDCVSRIYGIWQTMSVGGTVDRKGDLCPGLHSCSLMFILKGLKSCGVGEEGNNRRVS